MSDKSYKVKYDFEFGDFTKDEILETGSGGCDAVIVHSILYPEDGSYGHMLISKDGKTREPLSGNELWKAWLMMASTLSEDEDVPESKRELCKNVVDLVRARMAFG